MNWKKVSVINTLFVLLLQNVHAQTTSNENERYQEVTKKAFINCEAAIAAAQNDVQSDAKKYYVPIVLLSHDREYVENPSLYDRKKEQVDSLMIYMHKVQVIRYKYGGVLPDQTATCYNSQIDSYMDSTHGKFFYIEILNKVAKLNGEPPVFTEEDLEIMKMGN